MKVKVARWGNSLGVRLPKAAAEAAGLKAGTVLDVVVDGDKVTLKAAPRQPLPWYRLEDMVAEMKRLGGASAAPETVEWGPDVGSEKIDDEYSRGEITLDDILNGKDAAPRR